MKKLFPGCTFLWLLMWLIVAAYHRDGEEKKERQRLKRLRSSHKGTGNGKRDELGTRPYQRMSDKETGEGLKPFARPVQRAVPAAVFSPDQGPEKPERVKIPEPEAVRSALNVWVPIKGGTKYHRNPSCSGMTNPVQVTLDEAHAQGYHACGRCN